MQDKLINIKETITMALAATIAPFLFSLEK